MILSPHEVTGVTAEFQVCYDLSKRGLRAAKSPFEKAPYDVICEYHNKFLRVQVKGTSKPIFRSKSLIEYYQFNVPNIKLETFDILALVSTNLETIHYLSAEELKNVKSTIRIPVKQMKQNKDLALINVLNNLIFAYYPSKL